MKYEIWVIDLRTGETFASGKLFSEADALAILKSWDELREQAYLLLKLVSGGDHQHDAVYQQDQEMNQEPQPQSENAEQAAKQVERPQERSAQIELMGTYAT